MVKKLDHYEHTSLSVALVETAARVTVAESLKSGNALLTVVVPLYDEEENIQALYSRLKSVLSVTAPKHEIIFVNDGSKDHSLEKLTELWRQDECVAIISLRRNFGKAAALSAGFRRAVGKYVLMMDADLQDVPEELGKLIAKMDEGGYDMVTGWKQKRNDPWHKTMPSKLFNRTVGKAFGMNLHDFNCGYKLMHANVAKDLPLYGDFHRFIPVLASDAGYSVAECAVEHAAREHGVSKYGAKRLITGLLDFLATLMVTKFFHRPMQFFGSLGLKIAALSALVGAYLLIQGLQHGFHAHALDSVFMILAVASLQVFCTGLIAELIVNSTRRRRPDHEMGNALVHDVAQIR